MSTITPNQREAIAAIDDLSGDTFYVGGSAADKSINVNITGDIVVGDINLSKVGGVAISLGQTTMSASLPVTIASNQTALPVSQSGTWNINNISGTISLPTGAANQTKQDTGNTSLASIDSKTPALGQALATSSVPVVLTAAQISTLTPLSTVAATQSGTWSTRTLDGSGNTIGSTSNALDVNIKSGNITGFSTATNQTNGSQLTQIVDAGGDAVTVTGGKLDVNATISGSGGGTSSIDKAAFTIGSDTGTPAMGIYQTALDTVVSGEVAVVGLTSKRGMFVNLQTAAGAETGVAATPLQVSLANTASNSTAIKVDGSAATQPISGTITAVGAAADGAAVSGNPVLVAGQDGTNAQSLLTDTSGRLILGAGSNVIGAITNLIPGTGNTNLGAAISAASGSTKVGVLAIGIRDDALGTLTPTDGQYTEGLRVDSTGAHWVHVTSIDSAVTVTATNLSTNISQIGGSTVATGHGTASGALRVELPTDGTGTLATVGAVTAITNALPVGTNSIGKISDITTSVVPGTGATNLGKAEDAAHSDGDTGVFVLSRRIDAQATSSGSSGDYSTFNTDSGGGLYVTPSANAGVIGTAIYNNTALSSTKQAVNASAGNLYGYHIYNPNTSVIYVQLFNVASASVTVGTTAPTAVLAIPAGGWADSQPSTPITFGTALTIAATTTATGSGSPTTALLCNIWYK